MANGAGLTGVAPSGVSDERSDRRRVGSPITCCILIWKDLNSFEMEINYTWRWLDETFHYPRATFSIGDRCMHCYNF